MNTRQAVSWLFVALLGFVPSVGAQPAPRQPPPVVFGSIEPDYLFPWVVRVSAGLFGGCHGFLIAPHWVLTAAHCVATTPFNVTVHYERTSPTGVYTSGEQSYGTAVYLPPEYDPSDFSHDIALIHLRYPLDNGHPDPLLRPVELPVSQVSVGQTGILASTIEHEGPPPPPGMLSVLRGAVTHRHPLAFEVQSEESSACPGDSGSGFITTVAGKSYGVGIAANVPASSLSCDTPSVPFHLTNVYGYLDWIGRVTRLVGEIQGTGDFNGDGKSDVLWRNVNGTVAIWFMNNGSIQSQVYASVVPGNDWQIKGTGDFNADGKADILWRNNDGTVAIWLMNGGAITVQAYPGVPGNDWQIQGTGDFDDDGKSDIVWRNGDGTVALWFMNGGAIRAEVYPDAPGNDWQIRGTGDFNADGRADILWRNVDGTVALWFMNGGVIQARAYPDAPGNDWQIQGTGDFNGNGKSDILWRNNDGTVAIWFMNGGAIQARAYPGAPGNDWQIQGTGDFNSNGKSDILWRNGDRTVAIWFMNGGAIQAQAYPFVP